MAQQTVRPVGVSESKTPPVLCGVMVFWILLVFYFYQSSYSATWFSRNTLQVERVVDLFASHNFNELAHLLFVSNAATLNIWQMVISIYFLFLFGIPVEKRLGPIRFIFLILLAATIPWVVQIWDASHNQAWMIAFEQPHENANFFGPSSVLIALASAFLILVPKKEKDHTQSRLYRKNRTEIFNRSESKPITANFGFSPGFFFTAFLICVVAQHYYMMLNFKDVDSIGLFAGGTSLIIGYIVASLIHLGVEDAFQEHPLKYAAIKQYHELVDLDVSHENAVRGAAKGLGLPDYQVEEWVKKAKGKLRPQ